MTPMVLTPRISEKAIALAERGVYVFEVPMAATKIGVAQAVAAAFKVEARSVNVIIHKGKQRNFRRIVGRQRDRKKAMVTLKAGQSIKLFEGAA